MDPTSPQERPDAAAGLDTLEARADRLEARIARLRADMESVAGPAPLPRPAPQPPPLPAKLPPDHAEPPPNPIRAKVKAAGAGAFPGVLVGEWVVSALEGRYGPMAPELDAIVVGLVAAAAALAAGYVKRDALSPR